MATMALSMMDEEPHSDDGTETSSSSSTTTTDSSVEELEDLINDLDEKIEQNPENKEEKENPLEIAEENLQKEDVEIDKTEMETEKEDEKKSSNFPLDNLEPSENLEAMSPEYLEPTENLETLSPSSEDSTEDKKNDDKKSEMIMLPFKADENEENSEKSEMIKLSTGEDDKQEEPLKKIKKSRKQELVTMNDVENVRGILPDYDTSVVYEIISQLPIIRRCIIEHSYFKNELYNSNLYDLSDLLRNDPNRTLPIENKRAPETIDAEYLSSESLDTSSDPSDFLQQSTRSSVESERNYGDLSESDEDIVASGVDMAKCRLLKLVSSNDTHKIPILPKPPKLIKIGDHQSVSWDDIDKELSEVETMIKKRKEAAQMPGLMRMVRGRNFDIPLQMKATGEIRNSDIDEILAKVSEMNAKNLTKALEREKFKEEITSPGDSPSKKPEIKVKSVENINEELIKKELEHRLVREPKVYKSKVKNKAVLLPLGFKPAELTKPGPYYRLMNPGSTGQFFQISNKGRPVKPKVPGKIFSLKRPPNPYKKVTPEQPVFPVKSVEQKIVPPPTNTRFVRLVPYEPKKLKLESRTPEVPIKPEPLKKPDTTTKADKTEVKKQVSLYAFSNILKTILPENWLVAMDPRYGLQIVKTQMDGQLNPSLMLSVVVGRCGKIRINVRGRQLDKSHEIFSNIGTVANSEGKISVFYVLSLIEKLKMYSVCCGCDDPSLQKYWTDDGSTEIYTHLQKTFRSHSCELLVHLNKRRCYSCHRLNEKLKKRQRKDQLDQKDSAAPDLTMNEMKEISEIEIRLDVPPPEKCLKRNFEEESFEESFSSIKRKITDEIEKRKMDVAEKVPKTQEEVLSFMGLTRKDSLEQNSVRKSKREKKYFNKFEPNDINVSQMELDFLEKNWNDINTLFSTSMLFGAYSRTGSGRLRTKCMIFHKILKKWQKIIRDNPDWIGTDLIIYDQTLDRNETAEQIFRNLDIEDLRKYLMNAVKEVGKVKSRLKTKNSYFKCLYNKYVKRRAKRQKKDQAENSFVGNTDESSREKDDKIFADDSGNQELFIEYVSDGEK